MMGNSFSALARRSRMPIDALFHIACGTLGHCEGSDLV